jgi:hypothetical protein
MTICEADCFFRGSHGRLERSMSAKVSIPITRLPRAIHHLWNRPSGAFVGSGAHGEGGVVRIISAREAGKRERKVYEEGSRKDKDELRPEYKLSDFPKGLVRGNMLSLVRRRHRCSPQS